MGPELLSIATSFFGGGNKTSGSGGNPLASIPFVGGLFGGIGKLFGGGGGPPGGEWMLTNQAAMREVETPAMKGFSY
jgi:hypothetical protein